MRRLLHIADIAPRWNIGHFIAYTALCLLAFIPYMMVFYPGIVEIDTSFQLAMARGYGYGTIENYPSPFPPFDIRLLGALYSLGEMLGGTQNDGIFAICLFQCIGIASSVSLVSCYLSKWNVPPIARALVFLFSALVPITPLAAVDVGKDIIFCEFFVPFTICVIEMIRRTNSNEKISALLVIGAVATGFLSSCATSKGFVIVIVSVAVALLFAIKRRASARRAGACVLGAVLVLQLIMSIVIVPILSNNLPSTAGSSLRESLGTLVQQISWVERVSKDLTDTEKEQANRFFDLEAAAREYIPSTTDRTKVFTRLDADISDAASMLETYVSVGMRRPKEYLKSFIDLYEGYWKLGTADSVMIPRIMPVDDLGYLDWKDDTFSFPGTIDQAIEYIDNDWVCYSFGLLPEYEKYPDFGQWEMDEDSAQARADILTFILTWGKIPVANLLVSKSFYVLYVPLALLLAALAMAERKRKWVMLCLVPLGISCLFAFMSPADLTRYVYPCMFLVPMMSAIVLSAMFGKRKSSSEIELPKVA